MRNFTMWVAALSLLAMPAFAQLQDLQGRSHQLADYTGKGKWLVVMLWASDCHICNKEAKQYEAFYRRHKNKAISVLGLSLDGQENKVAAAKFIKEHGLNFPNLIGEPQQVALLYMDQSGQPWVGTPSFLIYDPKGKLRVADAGAVPVELIEDFIKKNSP